MTVTRGTKLRLFALLILAAFQFALPERAQASGECNLFCWTDCSSLEGRWCGAGCGGPGLLCMPGGICHDFDEDLVTVTCYAYDQ